MAQSLILSRAVARFAAVSHAVATAIRTQLPARAADVATVYPAIDLLRHTDMQQPANRELAAPHVICVGRLSGEKHVDAIIKGHSRVVREYPGATLTIVGDGGHRAALAQLVKRLDLTRSVRFLGRRDDVAELLRHANVYVSASSVEGLVGYATLEAALAGLPIVATNIPSVAELLEGLPSVRLVAPNRPEDIARAVDDIFSKRDIMADEIEATRRFLVSALDADSSIRELEQLYAAVA